MQLIIKVFFCSIVLHYHIGFRMMNVNNNLILIKICVHSILGPTLTMGSTECVTWEDGWTTLTSDSSRAAKFEHTVLITKTGVEVLTKL
jgi:methionine aminopeptidase